MMKTKRKKHRGNPISAVFKPKPVKAGPVRVVQWLEREEEKARQHLRAIVAG